jgi:hypothetical protein
MSPALPPCGGSRNHALPAVPPSALHLLATKATDADHAVVLLRADLSDLAPAAARRHAVQVFDAMNRRFPGDSIDVQVIDSRNAPLWLLGGGS